MALTFFVCTSYTNIPCIPTMILDYPEMNFRIRACNRCVQKHNSKSKIKVFFVIVVVAFASYFFMQYIKRKGIKTWKKKVFSLI